MNLDIHVITHCWSKDLPQYAAYLDVQLASIARIRKTFKVAVTVCYSEEDENTVAVIKKWKTDPCVYGCPLSNGMLWRRSIGRNAVGRRCLGSLFWFADCDYFVDLEFLPKMFEAWRIHGTPNLIWPQHCTAPIEKDRQNVTPGIPTSNWHQMPIPRAIGGVQFVAGDYIRQHGYLAGVQKYQTPVDRPFPNFKDDVVFRKTLQAKTPTSFCSVDVPGLYRHRHESVGYGKR